MIPASGYEWKPTPPVGKQPYYISARARCFPLLGYEMNGTTSKPEDVIVTCGQRSQREIHDRQPVVLEQFEPWLTGAAGPELLEPALEDLLQVAGIAQGEPGRQ